MPVQFYVVRVECRSFHSGDVSAEAGERLKSAYTSAVKFVIKDTTIPDAKNHRGRLEAFLRFESSFPCASQNEQTALLNDIVKHVIMDTSQNWTVARNFKPRPCNWPKSNDVTAEVEDGQLLRVIRADMNAVGGESNKQWQVMVEVVSFEGNNA